MSIYNEIVANLDRHRRLMKDYDRLQHRTVSFDTETDGANIHPSEMGGPLPSKRNKPVKLNKFYVAARHISKAVENGINDNWTQPTIEAAIRQAETQMDTEGVDTIVIVKIVKIVRRVKPRPKFKVEDVK